MVKLFAVCALAVCVLAAGEPNDARTAGVLVHPRYVLRGSLSADNGAMRVVSSGGCDCKCGECPEPKIMICGCKVALPYQKAPPNSKWDEKLVRNARPPTYI